MRIVQSIFTSMHNFCVHYFIYTSVCLATMCKIVNFMTNFMCVYILQCMYVYASSNVMEKEIHNICGL